MPKKLKRMLAVIAAQRGKPDAGVFTLRGFTIAQLDQVAEFVKSFSGTRPPAPDEVDRQTDIEARLVTAEALLVVHKDLLARHREQLAMIESRVDFAEQNQGYAVADTAPPGFPTGAATTAEDAIAQVEEPAEVAAAPPKRGDRVRLEDAVSTVNTAIPDGWYTVIGSRAGVFQIKASESPSDQAGAWLPWVFSKDFSLKEVRRG